ncbi:hypothetical protein [Nocardia sp. NPDC024068]|uniref:hypothetical protein n=1 Tax=Nocardia sp. NPDC024068 TaxID=3157197 RepID=UPI0033F9F40B
MTDAIHLLDAPESGAVATITGFLVGESDHDIRVRVADGTWTFLRRDVLAIRDSGRRAETPTGAVLVDIRAGATADFTRRLRIDIADRPMTLAAPPSETFGDAQLHRLAATWAAGLDIDAAHPTAFTRTHTRARHGGRHDIHCDSSD